jgi:hypothetical protein
MPSGAIATGGDATATANDGSTAFAQATGGAPALLAFLDPPVDSQPTGNGGSAFATSMVISNFVGDVSATAIASPSVNASGGATAYAETALPFTATANASLYGGTNQTATLSNAATGLSAGAVVLNQTVYGGYSGYGFSGAGNADSILNQTVKGTTTATSTATGGWGGLYSQNSPKVGGGDAFAEANLSANTVAATNISTTATATGGWGGHMFGYTTLGANGGSALATAWSQTENGDATATATASGGDGADEVADITNTNVPLPGRGGDGGSATAIAVADVQGAGTATATLPQPPAATVPITRLES